MQNINENQEILIIVCIKFHTIHLIARKITDTNWQTNNLNSSRHGAMYYDCRYLNPCLSHQIINSRSIFVAWNNLHVCYVATFYVRLDCKDISYAIETWASKLISYRNLGILLKGLGNKIFNLNLKFLTTLLCWNKLYWNRLHWNRLY